MKRIVVGVDGSDGATAALRWARDLAAQVGAELEVVNGWQLTPGGVDQASVPDLDQRRGQVEEGAREIVDQALSAAGAVAPDGVLVLKTVAEGSPESVLLERARDADLLVVGSGRRGGSAGVVLGSVSRQVVDRATVPVTVIPHTG
jgi:nucleotide-binding universal stress UspA family protein